MRWIAIVGVLACKPAASSTEPTTHVSSEPLASKGAAATVEPAHPYPVALLDVRGHEPLPTAPRAEVWIALDGLGATSSSGEVVQVEATAEDHVVPALVDALEPHAAKGTLVIWADERAPLGTVIEVLSSAGRAGFHEYAFVVGKPRAREIIRVDAPRIVGEGTELQGPAWADLFVAWSPEGVRAFAGARYSDAEPQPGLARVPLDVGGGSCLFPGGARPDPAAVQSVLDEMSAVAKPKAFALRVRLAGAEHIGDILWLLAADRRPASARRTAVFEAGLGLEPPPCAGAGSLVAALETFPPTASTQTSGAIVAATDEDVWGGLTGTEIGEAWGAAGGSSIGGTGSGYGRGSGKGFGGKGKRVPQVRQAKHTVEGQLDKDIIRRIVRAHINEVRHCYHQGIVRDAKLAGRVEIAFTIGSDGEVSMASVASTTLADAAVGNCMAKAVDRWKFPRPTDGKPVNVLYPFVLEQG